MSEETFQTLGISIEPRVRGIEKALQRIESQTRGTFNNVRKNAEVGAVGIERAFARADARVGAFAGSISRNLVPSMSAIVAALGTRQLAQLADTWTDLTSRVNLAAGSMDKGREVMGRLSEMARRTYSSLEKTAESFISNSSALKELGYSTSQQLDYTEALNNALVISAAKGQRAETVMNALAKAMAGGKLQGENLNTVIQQGGRVAEALAAGLGVGVNRLRDLGAAGKITSRDVFSALTSQMEQLRIEAEAMPATIADGAQLLRNAMLEYVGKADSAAGISAKVSQALVIMADNFDKTADAGLQLAGIIAGALIGRSLIGLTQRLALSTTALVSFTRALTAARSVAGLSAAMTGLGAVAGPAGMIIGGAVVASLIAFSSRSDDAAASARTYAEALEEVRSKAAEAADAIEKTADAIDSKAINVLSGGLKEGAADLANTVDTIRTEIAMTVAIFRSLDLPIVTDEQLSQLDALAAGLNVTHESAAETEQKLYALANSNPHFQKLADDLSPLLERIRDAIAAVDLLQTKLDTATRDPRIDAYRSYGESRQAARELERAANEYEREQLRRASLTKDALALEQEIAKVRLAAEKEGVKLSEERLTKIAKANLAGDAARSAEGRTKERASEFERLSKNIEKSTRAMMAENDAVRGLDPTMADFTLRLEKARIETELLMAAQEDGLPITAALRANIERLAAAYAAASAESGQIASIQDKSAKAAESRMGSLVDLAAEFGQRMGAAFAEPLREGEYFFDRIAKLIGELGDMLTSTFKLDWKEFFGLSSPTQIAAQVARSFPVVPAGPSPSSPAGGALAASGMQTYVPRAVASIEKTSNAFLRLVRRAEGTAGANGYNTTLGYGAFTGGATNLTGMTLDQIDAMQTRMLRHPNNHYNSSAAGAYQIVRTTLRGLRQELGLSGSQLYTPELQDRLGLHLAQRRGASVSGLRNEWEGLRRIDGGTILDAFSGSGRMPVAANQNVPQIQVAAPAATAPAIPATENWGSAPAGAGKAGNMAMAGLGALLSGFSSGYQSQDPGMGALTGLLGGIGSGSPIGMVAGLIGGLIGGFIGLQKAIQEAQEQIKSMATEIDNFVSVGTGEGFSAIRSTLVDYNKQAEEYIKLASKARDPKTVQRVVDAQVEFYNQMARDFKAGFEGVIYSLSSGQGLSGAFVDAQNGILDLREELKSFIADTAYIYGNTSKQVERAKNASREYLISLLGVSDEMSEIGTRLQELEGIASVMKATLKDLGMSTKAATKAMRSELIESIRELRTDLLDDINRSILSLYDKGYINEMSDAVKKFNERIRDMRALGIKADTAHLELALTLGNIAVQAGLSAEELEKFGIAAKLSGDMIAKATEAMNIAKARTAIDEHYALVNNLLGVWKNFIKGIEEYITGLNLNESLSTLSATEQLEEARKEYERVLELARGGDQDAMGNLQGAASTYLEKASGFWASGEEYAAIFREVKSGLSGVKDTAANQVVTSEQALVEARTQVGWLQAQNDNLVSLNDATNDLMAAIETYLGEGGSFSGTMISAMVEMITAAQQQVSATNIVASSIQLVSKSVQAVADALLVSAGKKSGGSGGKTVQDRANLEALNPGLYSILGGNEKRYAAAKTEFNQRGFLQKMGDWLGGRSDWESWLRHWANQRGYSAGGWTGALPINAVAGVTHGQEYVVKAPYAAQYRNVLEGINAGNGLGVAMRMPELATSLSTKPVNDNGEVVSELRNIVTEVRNTARVQVDVGEHTTKSFKQEIASLKQENQRLRKAMQFAGLISSDRAA